MSRLKTIGGTLALIGGIFILITVIINLSNLWDIATIEFIIGWILNLSIGVLAFIGGCMGLANNRSGGTITVIAGTVSVALLIVSYSITFSFYTPYSLIGFVMNEMGVTPIGDIELLFEAGLILLAGTFILVDSPE